MTGPKIAVLLPGRDGWPVGELRFGTDGGRRFSPAVPGRSAGKP